MYSNQLVQGHFGTWRTVASDGCHLHKQVLCRHRLQAGQQRSHMCKPEHRHVCQAAGGSTAVQTQTTEVPGGSALQIPETREAAIGQAAMALASQLKAGNKSKRGFKLSATKYLRIDLPEADDRPQAVVQQVQDLLATLPQEIASELTIIYCSDAAAHQAAQQRVAGMSLGDTFMDGVAGNLLVVGAKQEQIEALDTLLSQWRGSAVTLLNPEWLPAMLEGEQREFSKPFQDIYSFMPLSFQAFFVIRNQALLYRNAGRGHVNASQWHVLKQEGSGWRCIGRQQKRPTNENLEVAFYNASAAESPITKVAKLASSVFRRGKGKAGSKR